MAAAVHGTGGGAKAVRAKDIDAVTFLCASNIVSFDSGPTLRYAGVNNRRAWQRVFAAFAGPLAYGVHEFERHDVANRPPIAPPSRRAPEPWQRLLRCGAASADLLPACGRQARGSPQVTLPTLVAPCTAQSKSSDARDVRLRGLPSADEVPYRHEILVGRALANLRWLAPTGSHRAGLAHLLRSSPCTRSPHGDDMRAPLQSVESTAVTRAHWQAFTRRCTIDR